MFEDAFNLWIETVNEDCNIKEVLKDLGWTVTKSSVIPKEDNFEEVGEYKEFVPISFFFLLFFYIY
ncbi:MAG: hypothetical protein LBQ04_01700 [Endomicrobium sp.]|jgi:hypothetical protein|nr:hypothetical protein [Endomicrobium sp.]